MGAKWSWIWKIETDDLRKIIDESNSVSEVIQKLGYSHSGNYKTLYERCKHDGIDISRVLERSRKYCTSKLEGHSFEEQHSLDEILVENSSYDRGHLKKRLIRDGILKDECCVCGSPPVWQGKALTMVLDHINGVRNDHRRENLRLICPNCNSQTDTFAGRKMRSCESCGRPLKRVTPSGMCKKCSAKRGAAVMTVRSKRPPLDELVSLRRTMGREEVGRKFGVSGNTVKKWERQYGVLGTLPDGRTL